MEKMTSALGFNLYTSIPDRVFFESMLFYFSSKLILGKSCFSIGIGRLILKERFAVSIS